jgi:hypothetical protein
MSHILHKSVLETTFKHGKTVHAVESVHVRLGDSASDSAVLYLFNRLPHSANQRTLENGRMRRELLMDIMPVFVGGS